MSRLFDDANTEYLAITQAVVIDEPFTMACWFRIDANALGQTLMSLGDVNNQHNRHWLSAQMQYGGDPLAALSRDAGSVQGKASSTTSINLNTWHHAVGVWAADNDRSVYLDGGGKGSDATNVGTAGLDKTTIGVLVLGAGVVGPFSGRIAEAAIWNAALTDDEVRSLAGGVSPLRVRPESLVAYWSIYGVASPEPDYRGTYNLTLFSGDSGPVQADHSPTAPPFGFGLEQALVAAAVPVVGQPMMLRGTAIPHIRQWQPQRFGR